MPVSVVGAGYIPAPLIPVREPLGRFPLPDGPADEVGGVVTVLVVLGQLP